MKVKQTLRVREMKEIQLEVNKAEDTEVMLKSIFLWIEQLLKSKIMIEIKYLNNRKREYQKANLKVKQDTMNIQIKME